MMRSLGITVVATFAAACSLHPGPIFERGGEERSLTATEHTAAAAAHRERARSLRARSAEQERQARQLAGAAGGTLIGTDSNLYVAADYYKRMASYLAGAAARADESAEAHERRARDAPRP